MFAFFRSKGARRPISCLCLDRSSQSPSWWRHALLFRTLCLLALFSSAPIFAGTSPAAPVKLPVCAACHGPHGAGSATGVPRIAGMNAQYLSHALGMFKTRKRASPVMQPIAQTLSDSDIAALALYFSEQHPPLAPNPHPVPADLIEAGKTLAEHGGHNHVPACFSCHAAGGRGNGQRFPSIAGEPFVFVIDRLHEFQARARTGKPKPGTMTDVASHLTEAQIRDAAAYLSVLSPGQSHS